MTKTATGHTDAATSGRGQRTQQPSMRAGDRWFMILLTLVEIGASVLVVQIVKNHGGSDFAAYMWSMLPPLVGALVYWARTRHASAASAAILAFNLLSAGVAFFGSHDSKVLLYKDCFVTGIIGVIFAVSLVMPRPLTFWFGQRFATGGTPEGLAWWDGLWRYRGFRVAHRQMTVVWAVVSFVEAGMKALVIKDSSFKSAYLWTQIIPIGATVIGTALTFVIAKRASDAGEARRAAGAAGRAH